jgi:hypothetical protein
MGDVTAAISFYSEVATGVTEVALKINAVSYENLTQVPKLLKATAGEGNECKVLQ